MLQNEQNVICPYSKLFCSHYYAHLFETVPSVCSSSFVDCDVVGSVAVGSWTLLFLFVVFSTLSSVVEAFPDLDSFHGNTGTVDLTLFEPSK